MTVAVCTLPIKEFDVNDPRPIGVFFNGEGYHNPFREPDRVPLDRVWPIIEVL